MPAFLLLCLVFLSIIIGGMMTIIYFTDKEIQKEIKKYKEEKEKENEE